MTPKIPDVVQRHVDCLRNTKSLTPFAFIQAPMFARPSWFEIERNAAPTMTPQTLPIPPRMTMQRMNMEMLK